MFTSEPFVYFLFCFFMHDILFYNLKIFIFDLFETIKEQYLYFCEMFLLIQRKIINFLLPIFFYFMSLPFGYSQDTFKPDIALNKLENHKDSSPSYIKYPYNKRRVNLVKVANIVGYGGTLVALNSVSYTHLRAHETDSYLVCRL